MRRILAATVLMLACAGAAAASAASQAGEPVPSPRPQPPAPPRPAPPLVMVAQPPHPAAAASGEDAWIERPGPADFERTYPPGAKGLNLGAEVDLSCLVAPDGRPSGCGVVYANPSSYAFEGAAIKLARLYRVDPASPGGRRLIGQEVRLHLVFGGGSAGNRVRGIPLIGAPPRRGGDADAPSPPRQPPDPEIAAAAPLPDGALIPLGERTVQSAYYDNRASLYLVRDSVVRDRAVVRATQVNVMARPTGGTVILVLRREVDCNSLMIRVIALQSFDAAAKPIIWGRDDKAEPMDEDPGDQLFVRALCETPTPDGPVVLGWRAALVGSAAAWTGRAGNEDPGLADERRLQFALLPLPNGPLAPLGVADKPVSTFYVLGSSHRLGGAVDIDILSIMTPRPDDTIPIVFTMRRMRIDCLRQAVQVLAWRPYNGARNLVPGDLAVGDFKPIKADSPAAALAALVCAGREPAGTVAGADAAFKLARTP